MFTLLWNLFKSVLQLVLTNITSIPAQDGSSTDSSNFGTSSSNKSKPQRCLYNSIKKKSKAEEIKILKEEVKKTRSRVASLENTCGDWKDQLQEMSSLRKGAEYWIETRKSLLDLLELYRGKDGFVRLAEDIQEIGACITEMESILAVMDKYSEQENSPTCTKTGQIDKFDSLNGDGTPSSDESESEGCLFNKKQKRSEDEEIKILKEKLKKISSRVASLENTCGDENQPQEISPLRRGVEDLKKTKKSLSDVLKMYRFRDEFVQLAEVVRDLNSCIIEMKSIIAMDENSSLKKCRKYTEIERKVRLVSLKSQLKYMQVQLCSYKYSHSKACKDDPTRALIKRRYMAQLETNLREIICDLNEEEKRARESYTRGGMEEQDEYYVWQTTEVPRCSQCTCERITQNSWNTTNPQRVVPSKICRNHGPRYGCAQVGEDIREINIRITEVENKFAMDKHSAPKKYYKCADQRDHLRCLGKCLQEMDDHLLKQTETFLNKRSPNMRLRTI